MGSEVRRADRPDVLGPVVIRASAVFEAHWSAYDIDHVFMSFLQYHIARKFPQTTGAGGGRTRTQDTETRSWTDPPEEVVPVAFPHDRFLAITKIRSLKLKLESKSKENFERGIHQ